MPSGNITIAVASDVGASTNTVLVTVQDGTKSKDREVTASITVSVIDKPEPPLLSPVAGEPQDSAVSLTWTPGAAMQAVTNYKVSWTRCRHRERRIAVPSPHARSLV